MVQFWEKWEKNWKSGLFECSDTLGRVLEENGGDFGGGFGAIGKRGGSKSLETTV